MLQGRQECSLLLKEPCFPLMYHFSQNLGNKQLVFPGPSVSKEEMEPEYFQLPQSTLSAEINFIFTPKFPSWHQNLAITDPGCTEDFGLDSKVFFLTIIILDNFKSHENHSVDLLLHILLTSSTPEIFTALLITYSHGCSMELSSCNYFTSHILEQTTPLPGGKQSSFDLPSPRPIPKKPPVHPPSRLYPFSAPSASPPPL